jgi:hypothetical protein
MRLCYDLILDGLAPATTIEVAGVFILVERGLV